jgi:hypothetical protein
MADGPPGPIASTTERIAVDAEKQTATVRFGKEIKPGRYRLSFDYAGKIYTQASGLFALDYVRPPARSARCSPSSRRRTPAASSPAGTSRNSARPTR